MTLKDHKLKNDTMYENSHYWRKKLRLQSLVDIARTEIESGKNFEDFSHMLEQEMKTRWRLVRNTRKQYLGTLRKILDNHIVLIH